MERISGRAHRQALLAPLLGAVLLTGCGGESTMDVSLVPPDRYPGVTLEVADRLGVRTFGRSTLRSTPLALETGRFGVATEGTLRLRLRLEEDGRTVARGGVRLPAREDHRWGIRVFYGERDPAERCLDCRGSRAIRLAESHRAAPGEALWIVWGGREE